MMNGGQQKIHHKGTNNKVKAFITLLYPLNKIKFNTTGKTRNSNDFINHLRNIKMYVIKRGIKRFILIIDNASFHASKKTRQCVERQSKWLTVLYLPKKSTVSKPRGNQGRQESKAICANYCYETEKDLICPVRRYLRRNGCWPKI
ncbi:hypothetical protein BH23THE1_BH23THE1_07840 [soil metagenome]